MTPAAAKRTAKRPAFSQFTVTMTRPAITDDPKKKAGECAARSRQILAAYSELCGGCEKEHVLSDLLADLMHGADRSGVDFEEATGTAREHFIEERRDACTRPPFNWQEAYTRAYTAITRDNPDMPKQDRRDLAREIATAEQALYEKA